MATAPPPPDFKMEYKEPISFTVHVGGGDNYNSLNSKNNEFSVITVNSIGQMMIGSRPKRDLPSANLQVYGSLLVEGNNAFKSDIVSGVGSRWMWYAERSILRIGYTPSTYWDANNSGDYSIAFGYGSLASGIYSIVTGGYYNQVSTHNSIIMGGSDNIVSGPRSIILGGQKNIIDSSFSVVLGGFDNTAANESIILGGHDNYSSGQYAILSGYKNNSSGRSSIIFGGSLNSANADQSILLGSKITTPTDNVRSVVFNAANEVTESVASSHIKINAPSGVGIGTNVTSPNALTVAGSVTANILYGDATNIVNIKNPISAWVPFTSTFLSYPYRLGVGTSQLYEALNVSGSINISGPAAPIPGTIRYLDDIFSVYKNGKWINLQIDDTNTTYNVDQSLALDTTANVFSISTKNAVVGQVKKWNGTYWQPAYVDQFDEQPEASRNADVTLQKRLFFSSGNVAINIADSHNVTNNLDYSLSVHSDSNETTGAYFYEMDGTTEKKISFSVDPPGIHFQGHYEGSLLKQTSVDGGGIFSGDQGLTFYIDDATGVKRDVLMLSTNNIDILSVEPTGTAFPFYVGGDFATKSFVFRTDADGVGIFMKEPLFVKSANDATIFSQKHNGEVFIQSASKGGDIVLSQSGRQIAKLRVNSSGVSEFGLTDRIIRSGLDVKNGHVHVSSTYGIDFYNQATKKSGISFSSIDQDHVKRIEFHTSGNFSTPNLEINKSGDVAVNGATNHLYDLILKNVDNRDTIFQVDTVTGKNPAVFFHVDGVSGDSADDDYMDNGESYKFKMHGDDLILTEDVNDVPAITITQTGKIGLFDPTPSAPLSVGQGTVLLNQKGIYFKETNGTAGSAVVLDGNIVNFKSSDEVDIFNLII